MTSRQGPDPVLHDARRAFLTASGWFDAAWYTAQVEDGGSLAGDEKAALEHFLRIGSAEGIAPNQFLAGLQAGPYAVKSWDDEETPIPPARDPQLRREVALVVASGLFDAEFYAVTYPKVAERVDDLVLHFCRYGWREVKQPSADFDVWHYWYTHLDPARDDVNPLVHYLVMGAPPALSTRASWTRPGPGATLPQDRPLRRACLFAAYDADGVLDESLVAYVRELSRFADVFFLADCFVDRPELQKLDGIAEEAWAIRHGAYDFGSYSMLARDLVGWERLAGYDEVLLVNDSCYLLRPLDDVFAQMESRVCDWWGLQATKGVARTATPVQDVTVPPVPMSALQGDLLREFSEEPEYDFLVASYFLAYRQPVVRDAGFRRILDSVHKQRGKAAIIHKYEIGITQYLISNGYRFDTFVDSLYPFQPVFTNQYFRLLERGFPLLKKYFLYQNHYDTPDLREWKARILAVVPDAPVEAMEVNLLRTAPDDRLQRSFAIVTEPDGGVLVPREWEPDEFRADDEASPTFAHWWAFVVGRDGRLSTSSRVLLNEVTQDPSLKKIVLSTTRPVEAVGENVVTIPLASPEGHHHLVRAGVVILSEDPTGLPVSLTGQHRLVVLRDGITFERRRPLSVRPARTRRDVLSPVQLFVSASEVDRVAVTSDLYPASFEAGFTGGIPALDVLTCPSSALPAELRSESERLAEDVGGRSLVVVVPPSGDPADSLIDEEDADWLAQWCDRHDAVLGVHDEAGDHRRATWRALRSVALDLGGRRFTSTAVVLRSASALLSASPGRVLDFSLTGRPVILYIPERLDRPWYHSLDHAMPAPVIRKPAELREALDVLALGPQGSLPLRYERARDLFHDPQDSHSGWRLAQRLRRLAREGR